MKALTLPILFAIGTALCWGCYGPVIGKARHPDKLYSPFKPYVGIGVAYLVIAIFGGLAMMAVNGDSFSFTAEGHKQAGIWGFFGGSLGAFGALCLTSAMLSFQGPPKPQLVMPIVFGGAVSITAIISVIQNRQLATASPWLWVGMAGVVVSIVLVAYNTPHGHPAKHAVPQSDATANASSHTSPTTP
jgi:drug/metabolite transporter (DMT)-like permease